VNALDWLRDDWERPIRPVFTVFGDDAYLVRESVKAVIQTVFPGEAQDAMISRFPGATAQLATVLDEVFTLPFFTRRRLVIVEDADPFITKYRKDLEAYVEKPSESGILLFQTKQWVSTTILAKLVDAVGLAIDCNSPKENSLAPWLTRMARSRYQTQLDADAARLLIELVGPDAGILASEVEKLAVYAGETQRIEPDDITKLVGAGRVETIWKTLDAALAGQGRLAIEYLDQLVAAGEDPVPILAAMSANLLKVHHAGEMRAARLSLAEACQLAGVPPFAVQKTGKQHAHLGPARVGQLPELLLKADLDIKGGSSLDPRVVLEVLLVQLALPRTD
jgi:DNA polymerase-3 subunit delta